MAGISCGFTPITRSKFSLFPTVQLSAHILYVCTLQSIIIIKCSMSFMSMLAELATFDHQNREIVPETGGFLLCLNLKTPCLKFMFKMYNGCDLS